MSAIVRSFRHRVAARHQYRAAELFAEPILAAPPGCTATTSSYDATAIPLGVGLSGRRAFATNEGSTIFYDDTGVPPADPIPAGAAAIH